MPKQTKYTLEAEKTAAFYKALGHPARLSIIKFLSESNTCICSDLLFELPLSRTTIMQHLETLKKEGLLNYYTKGKKIYYCLNSKQFKEHKKNSETFLNSISITENNSC